METGAHDDAATRVKRLFGLGATTAADDGRNFPANDGLQVWAEWLLLRESVRTRDNFQNLLRRIHFGCSHATCFLGRCGRQGRVRAAMAQFAGGSLELFDCLADHVVHLVGGPWAILIVVTLEEVPRQVAGREGPARLVERSAGPVDSLRDQTLLHR